MSKKPLYIQIVKFVKDKINSGEWLEGDKIPSEKELAELFEVSSITSKRALRELQMMNLIVSKKGSGSFVADRSREKHGRKSASPVISLVLPLDAMAHEVKDYIAGASSFLQTKDYFLTVHITSQNAEKEKEMLLDLEEKGMGGIIFYPCYSSKNAAIVATMRMNGVPIVTIDKSYEGLPVSSVMSDNFKGGFLSAEYLIGHGHKKIAYLSNVAIERSSSVRDRYVGFSSALAQYGIVNDIENHLLDSPFGLELEQEDDIEAFRKHADFYMDYLKMLRQKGVTALVCSCDSFAYWIINLCGRLGYDVPNDFSVIGFDKVDLPFKTGTQLTTVKQDFYCMGYKAAEVIWNIINHNMESQSIVLPVEFIEGKTVKSLKPEEDQENQSMMIG